MKEIKLELPIVDLSGVCESMNELKKAVEEYSKREVIVRLGTALGKSGVKCSDIIEGSDEEVILDFSEHDKMVAEEKDKRIAEIERDLKEYRDEVIAVRKNRDEMMEGFRNGIKPYVDLCQMHERIAELEKENSALKEKLSLIRTRATAEAREFWDKDMFGSFIITIPRKSNDNEIIEKLEKDLNRLTMDLKNRMGQIHELREENKMLKEENKNLEAFTKNLLEDSGYVIEERQQSDCIRINQLLTTIDVLTERYQKLREVHGL